jgi:uroporphyrinogen decarboxylase
MKNKTLNSREIVLKSVNFEQPDRVPVDFGGHRSSGISAIAYSKLRDFMGLPKKPIRVYDMIQQLAVVDEDVCDIFGIDVVEMGRGFHYDNSQWKDWVLPDGTICQIPDFIKVKKTGENWLLYSSTGQEVGIQKKGCLYFEQTYFPLMERGIENDDFSDLADHMGQAIWAAVPHPGAEMQLDDEGLKKLEEGAKSLRNSTDRAIIGLFGGNLFEFPQWLYRMDNFMMYLGLYPDQVLKMTEKLCNIHLANLDKWLSAVGPYIDIIMFGDDLGGQNGPLISPQMYRKFYKPFHSRLWNRAKEAADVKVQLHCCGGVSELLGDLTEAGLDIINPVQITCEGMETEKLKAEFGQKITLWGGGCDTRDILPNENPQAVKDHINRQLEILFPGGGFVFQQVHNIMANVPPANIVEMFETIKKFSVKI